jgi:hypothetical protein
LYLYEKTLDRDNFPEDLLTFYNRFSDRWLEANQGRVTQVEGIA